MITTNFKSIIDSVPILQKIINEPLSARTSFLVAKISREIDNEIVLYNKTRDNIIKTYCSNENGDLKYGENGEIIVPDDVRENLHKELIDLVENVDVTLNCNKIPIELMEDAVFTPKELMPFLDFIE